MQGLILAAGRGSRLGKKGFGRPKCLLEIGRRPLIERTLEALAEAGVAPNALVVGYCADEVRETVGIRAEYVENVRWKATNSLYSFWLAREWVTGDVLILNSDVLFDPAIVDRLLDCPGDALAYDSTSGDAREHMKVRIEDGLLVDMGKELPVEDACGENVGIIKLTKQGAEELFEIADELIQAGAERDWLGSALRKLAARRRLAAVDVAGLPWGEIDSSYDLAHARRDILPAIKRARRRRAPTWRLVQGAVVTVFLIAFGIVAAQAWIIEPDIVWESVDIEGLESVKISTKDRKARWHVLSGEAAALAEVAGPAVLRIDTRLILSEEHPEPQPYVLELRLDGRRLDWFKHHTEGSGTWDHPTWNVGRRERTEIELPEGTHSLETRLVASDSGVVLLRIRQSSGSDNERD